MRLARAIVVGLSCALGACVGPEGAGFGRVGIGTDLYAPDLPQATALLEIYSSNICRQANLPQVEVGAGVLACDYPAMRPAEWNSFVQMGLYDIDRRCDAYLAWLDERRRTRGAVVQQISDTRSLVQSILTVTGVSAAPITIVANALGYAADSYSNLTSRLLYDLDLTTVQAVISARQDQRKREIAGLDFTTKPAALNGLRLYLRTCLPHTIERRVNESATIQSYGLRLAAVSDPDRIDAATTGARALTARTRVGQVVRPVPPGSDPSFATLIQDYSPRVHGRTLVVDLQAALCVPRAERGTIGASTASLVGVFERNRNIRPSEATKTNGLLDRAEQTFLLGLGECDVRLYRNVFERIRFERTRLTQDLVRAADILIKPPLPSDATLANLRQPLPELRMLLKAPGPDTFDAEIIDKLLDVLERPAGGG